MAIDADTQSLLQQHRQLALNNVRWPWQADPNDFLNDIDYAAQLLCSGNENAAYNLTNDVNRAHQQLTANLDVGFGGAARDLQDWTGSAADGFSKYLLQVKEAIGKYDDILHDFRQLQAGYESLVSGCVTDVQNLVNKAIDAQKGLQGEVWTVGLTAVAGVASAIGAIISGPVGWAIVTSAVAVGASTTSVLISTSGPGETAQSLRDGLLALQTDVENQRDSFWGAIQQLVEYLDGSGTTPVINPQPPGFITAPSFDPSSFDLPSNIESPGIENGVSRAPLVKPSPQQSNSQITTRLGGA